MKTEKITLSLRSSTKDGAIKVKRILVEETPKGGKPEMFIIDMDKKEVYHDKKRESTNTLTVGSGEDTYKMQEMTCGAQLISKPCGFIQLPKNYNPGLNCVWTITAEKKLTYTLDSFEVRTTTNFTESLTINVL